jgi:di/tricarboxylate transporter
MAIWIVSLITISALFLLITEKIAIEITAVGIMAALMVTGVLTPGEAVAGFANPAVVTVAAMFVISRALVRTGVVGMIASRVIDRSKGKVKLASLLILLMVAGASAFVNNTPVVVLFIPIVLSLSCEFDFSPSKYLMPISYASILAGTCTLIGTSTNILVSNLSAMHGYGTLGMFELSPLGVPIAVLGVAFLYLFSQRLMPDHAGPTCEMKEGAGRRYLAEFLVPVESPLIGRQIRELFEKTFPAVEVFETIRGSRIFYPHGKRFKVAAGDLLFLKGSANDFVGMLNEGVVELPHSSWTDGFTPGDQQSLIVELIIPPQSSLAGEKLQNTQVQRDPAVSVIAVKRQKLHYTEKRIEHVRLKVGDILLVRCPEQKLDQIRASNDFIVFEDVHYELVHKQKAGRAAVVFGGVVIAASLGVADIMVCALVGVFLLLLTGCVQVRGAYRALQGNVLMLIVGTIALGHAMEKTGAASLYAETFLALFQELGPSFVLSGIMVLTSIGTHLLSNNATAVIVLPVAIAAAGGLGVDPKPFIVGVCFGASACYATPIGYQTNLMVYGPGRYRFTDYLKMGIPLNVLVLIMGSLFIPKIWPF